MEYDSSSKSSVLIKWSLAACLHPKRWISIPRPVIFSVVISTCFLNAAWNSSSFFSLCKQINLNLNYKKKTNLLIFWTGVGLIWIIHCLKLLTDIWGLVRWVSECAWGKSACIADTHFNASGVSARMQSTRPSKNRRVDALS